MFVFLKLNYNALGITKEGKFLYLFLGPFIC